MTTIRRFFDIAPTEPAGAVNIAEAMAKYGVKNDSTEPVATPIPIEAKTEPVPEEKVVTPAETATELQTTETVKEEPQQVQKEVVVTPAPAIPESQPKPPTLQEVLKIHQPQSVLNELGYDDKTVQLLNKVKGFDPKVLGLIEAYENGTHIDYLRELTTDYSKMSAEDVMRHQLKQDYPKASDAQLQILYEDEVLDKYKIDPDKYSEAEVERGKMLLEAKAGKYRDDFATRQQQYLVPKAPEPKAEEPNNMEAEANQKFVEYKNKFTEDQYTRSVFSNKKISIGEGADQFNYPVEPDDLIKVLYSSDGWMDATSKKVENGDGTTSFVPNVEHQILIGAVAKYGKVFLDEYAKHYKSIGGKSVVADIENAKEVDTTKTSTPDAAPKSAAEAMARGGVYNSGGYNR